MANNSNSILRKVAKRVLRPLLSDRFYKPLQAAMMATDILRGKFWEPELALIPVVVHEGDSVLDLGANYGLYCYHLSKAIGKTGKIFAFEPVPFTFDTLRMITRMLRIRNVELIRKGVSNHNGQVTFSIPVQTSGAIMAGQAHLGNRNDEHPGKETQVRWGKTNQIVCEVVALDDYLPLLQDLAFIKADIEGAEYFAFKGGEKVIDQHSPSILCEINPWFLEGFGVRLADLLDFFWKRDYALYHYEEREGLLREVTSASEVVEANYWFIPPLRRERFTAFLATESRKQDSCCGKR